MIALQLLINGLIAGATYALIAGGFVLIYSTNRFLHFAHGAVAVAGGYILYALVELAGWPPWLGIIASLLLTGLLGCLCFAFVYRPLQKKNSASTVLLIASLGLLILLQNIVRLIFGSDAKYLDIIPAHEGMVIGGAYITPLQIIMIIVAGAALSIMGWWLYKSHTGRLLRAVADNPELAGTTGIPIIRLQYLSFFAGSMLAGLGGILIGIEQGLEPMLGTYIMIKAFTGAVIGGVTSVPGALLGSLMLGIIENLGVWWLPAQYKDAIAFSFLFLFLLVRPYGLFGVNKGARL